MLHFIVEPGQRVKKAKVDVENTTVGEIGNGLLLYIGFEDGDDIEKVKWSVNKIINLRVFQDEDGKMNKSLMEIKGQMLAISNFTLPADLTESGRRPSFSKSAKPEIAEKLYVNFLTTCNEFGVEAKSGKFGAMMDVKSINDGPINLILKR